MTDSEVLEKMKHILGDNYPNTILVMNILAGIRRKH